jgi:hemoglobin
MTSQTPFSLAAQRVLLCMSVLASIALTGCGTWPANESTGARPLFQQLGGIESIARVTERTLERVAQDPRGARSFKGVKMPFLKKSVAAYLCKVADGPCVYEGDTMHKSHASLDITGSEFDLMVQVLREELDAAGASAAAKNELLRRLAPTRKDIVKS